MGKKRGVTDGVVLGTLWGVSFGFFAGGMISAVGGGIIMFLLFSMVQEEVRGRGEDGMS